MTYEHDEELTPAERSALDASGTPPPFPADSLWSAVVAGQQRRAAFQRRQRRLLALAASLVAFVAGAGAGYALGRDAAPEYSAGTTLVPSADSLITVTWF